MINKATDGTLAAGKVAAATVTATTIAATTITQNSKAVASGTKAAHLADANTAHDLNATFSDTEAEAALNALGTKINTIIDALEAFGIMAAS